VGLIRFFPLIAIMGGLEAKHTEIPQFMPEKQFIFWTGLV
jgi:hypothetical protein